MKKDKKIKIIEIKEKGVWIVYDLEANRRIQELLQKEGYIFRFDPSLELEKRKNLSKACKVIDDNWYELMFDMHTRFCKIMDVGGRTQKMCSKFKEAIKKDLKERIKGK